MAGLTLEAERIVRPHGEVMVIACLGELDLATAPELRDTLGGVDDADVLVDLSATTFLDSTGLSTLLNALRRVTRAGHRLAVTCGPGTVRDTIRMTGLVETLRVADDRSSALRSLAR